MGARPHPQGLSAVTRRWASAILGIIWVIYGSIFVATAEPRSVFGDQWEDARGWVWMAAGALVIATAGLGRHWPLAILGGLAGERIAVLAWLTVTARPAVQLGDLAALTAWCGVMLAVILTVGLPERGRR